MKHIAVNMKILYLSPGLREPGSVQKRIDRWSWVPGLLGEDTTIVGRGLRRGSEYSEGDFDDYAGGSEVVKTIMEAVGEGFDAVVIGDTGDPFVPGIREVCTVSYHRVISRRMILSNIYDLHLVTNGRN